ncbi:unnamed protein product [Urochloa humidicola]
MAASAAAAANAVVLTRTSRRRTRGRRRGGPPAVAEGGGPPDRGVAPVHPARAPLLRQLRCAGAAPVSVPQARHLPRDVRRRVLFPVASATDCNSSQKAAQLHLGP